MFDRFPARRLGRGLAALAALTLLAPSGFT